MDRLIWYDIYIWCAKTFWYIILIKISPKLSSGLLTHFKVGEIMFCLKYGWNQIISNPKYFVIFVIHCLQSCAPADKTRQQMVVCKSFEAPYRICEFRSKTAFCQAES